MFLLSLKSFRILVTTETKKMYIAQAVECAPSDVRVRHNSMIHIHWKNVATIGKIIVLYSHDSATDLRGIADKTDDSSVVLTRSFTLGACGGGDSGLNPSRISNIPVLNPFLEEVISSSFVSILSALMRETHMKHIIIVYGNVATIAAPSVHAQYTF